MLSPGQAPLTDRGSGRISMPFLPTLAVVVALVAASAFCPSAERAAPAPSASAPGPTAFAEPAAIAAPAAVAAPARLPAALAFAAAFPTLAPPATGAVPSAARPHAAQRLAGNAKKGCPGRGCPELPHRAAALPPGDGDPLAAARAEGGTAVAEDGFLPPLALPFAEARASVAQTLAPAARLVGQAADLMRGGGASVTGSVVRLAECLP